MKRIAPRTPPRPARRAAALACLATLLPAAVAAEPMSVQPARVPDASPAARSWAPGWAPDWATDLNAPQVQPYYGGNLERRFDEQDWRDRRESGFSADRPSAPSGFIASMGRFGLKVDSSGDGPKIRGLAWTPNDSMSVVAGGNLGSDNGVGASLSIRFSF